MKSENNLQESLGLTSINELWGKLIALYGRAFTQQYGIEIDKEGIWGMALTFVSPSKLEYGFKKLLLSNQFKVFPPNPLQFRELCELNPNHKYLPSSKDALIEAKNYFSRLDETYNWSHPVVKFCAAKLGRKAFETLSPKELGAKFCILFEKATFAHNQGLPLHCNIKEPTTKNTTKEIGKCYLKKIKSQLGAN
jgi:hypothetical protein